MNFVQHNFDSFGKAITKPAKSFMDLPAKAQTAIFSFAYQYGPGFMHKSLGKRLWQAYTTQNWSAAAKILRGSARIALAATKRPSCG